MLRARMKTKPPARIDKATRARTASRFAARRRKRSPNLFHWAGLEAAPRPQAFDPAKLTQMAMGLWRACVDPRTSTLADSFFASRGVVLPDGIGTDSVRFHPALRFGDGRAAALVFLLRNLHSSGEVTGVFRQYIDAGGAPIGRRVLGAAWSSAIKFSDDTDVEEGLHIASNVETGIAAMNAGYRPLWCLVGANSLSEFPVLDGVECLTIIDGDARAVAECAVRWRNAGRAVMIPP